jgi:antitoxin ParD1/3/4
LSKKEMGRNTSVSLGDYFENFVDGRISEGRYKNASEVIRAGLRLLEEEETKIKSLRQAIQEGIDSGIARNFHPQKHLKLLKTNKRKSG